MSREARRTLGWYVLVTLACGYVAIVGYAMREHKFMMADDEALSGLSVLFCEA